MADHVPHLACGRGVGQARPGVEGPAVCLCQVALPTVRRHCLLRGRRAALGKVQDTRPGGGIRGQKAAPRPEGGRPQDADIRGSGSPGGSVAPEAPGGDEVPTVPRRARMEFQEGTPPETAGTGRERRAGQQKRGGARTSVLRPAGGMNRCAVHLAVRDVVMGRQRSRASEVATQDIDKPGPVRRVVMYVRHPDRQRGAGPGDDRNRGGDGCGPPVDRSVDPEPKFAEC
jgi:hypothetical protein